jgi:chromosome segregation ATPase
VDFILKAIERNQLTGFDYVAFRTAMNSLLKMGLDLPTAIKSAFATAATVGLTKGKLLDTAAHYRNVVVKEKQLFDDASQKQQDQRIGAKLAEIAAWKKDIEQKEAQIEALKAEITRIETSVRTSDFDIEQAVQKINEAKQKFNTTHQTVLAQIDKDIADIQANLA